MECKKILRVLLIILCIISIVSISPILLQTYADTESTEQTEDGTVGMSVTVVIGSTFTVRIPKEIKGTSKTFNYTVGVCGEIGETESIMVIPESTFTLSAEDKEDVLATVIQEKQSWGSTELTVEEYTETTGTITANELTEGEWTGILSFEVKKVEDAVSLAGVYADDNMQTYTWDSLTSNGYITVMDNELTSQVNRDSSGTYYNDSLDIIDGKLVIQDGITSVGYQGLMCLFNMTDVKLPDSLTRLNEDAFRACKGLTNVDLNKVEYVGTQCFYNSDAIETVEANSVKDIVDYAFNGCTSLTSISMPAVESIGIYAFKGCTSLSSVTLPSTLNSLGAGAFYDCTGLSSIDITHLTVIGNGAFFNCDGLTKVTLSDDLESIGEHAFGVCANLSVIEYKGVEYTDATTLTSALKANGVTVGTDNTEIIWER